MDKLQTLATSSAVFGQGNAQLPPDTSMTSSADFHWQIERIIGLLSGQHFLRLSLFRIELTGDAFGSSLAKADRALRSHGLVGELPDGSIGFLYLGPRAKGQGADLTLERHVAERLHQELSRGSADTHVRVLSVAHRWADEVSGADDLLDAVALATIMRKAS